MTNVITTKKALLSSAVALLLCFAMLMGTTFAWFTDSSASGSNVITAGNLDIVVEYTLDGETWKTLDGANDLFSKGLWEPGHTEVVALRIKNNGTLALKYAANMNIVNENVGKTKDGADIVLSDILTVTTVTHQVNQVGDILLDMVFGGSQNTDTGAAKAFKSGNILASDQELFAGDAHYVIITVDMAETVGNEANHNGTNIPSINFGINVLATQFTYENDSFGNQYDKDSEYPATNTADVWDGSIDISWYTDNPDATEFSLNTASAVAGLAALVDGSAVVPADVSSEITLPVTFEGKTVKLTRDVDLYAEDANGDPICFEPIGGCRSEVPFMGTFDGQGHTVSNMSQNTWALNNGYYYSGELGIGLFGGVEDAVIKNLVVDGASISGESALCGAVAGVAMGDCTFENITVKNAQVNDYQYGAGGIVGWASGNQTYKGINVDETTVVGSQWGDFGNANGGIIGQADTSGTYHFEDCTVACRIDATNDIVSAYQWYCYRNSGMLIGKVDSYVTDEVVNVVAENVTCKNVTVIYNDWANYTYCEFAGTSYPYVRVQAGTSVDAYSNIRYGHPTDANGNTVVDDNHVHNDGEDHHLLIAFDQLFGGPANHRYCYYGVAEHEGVTVVYNNK